MEIGQILSIGIYFWFHFDIYTVLFLIPVYTSTFKKKEGA